MNFREALLHLREYKHRIAIYDELIAHLEKFTDEDEDMNIPVDDDAEEVDIAYIDEVMEHLNAKKAEQELSVEKLEDADIETGDEDVQDHDGAGAASSG